MLRCQLDRESYIRVLLAVSVQRELLRRPKALSFCGYNLIQVNHLAFFNKYSIRLSTLVIQRSYAHFFLSLPYFLDLIGESAFRVVKLQMETLISFD